MSKLNSRKLYGLTIFALLFVSVFAPAFIIQPVLGWWNTNWPYRKVIVIDHTKVDADLTNFPVLIDITDADLASKAQNDGDDIVFTDSSDTKLSHEIELYDSGTGHLVAWVKVPSLSSTVDTTFYMYYGNPSASNQEDPSGVWDSNYVMVQHLEETSGTHNDSTAYNNDGTPLGGLNQDAAGKIDGADEFDGDNDLVEVANSASLKITDAITYEAWVYCTAAGTNYVVDNAQTAIGRVAGDYPDFYIPTHTPGTLKADTIATKNVWHHLAWTYDKDAGTNNRRIYLDGVLVANDTQTAKIGTASNVLTIGNYRGAGPGWAFDGIIDEVRVSNMARGSAWISTSYKNQHNPSEFCMISIDPFAEGWQCRKAITIDHTKVDADLTNFPVLIDITDGDLASLAQSNGDDILFVNSSGVTTKLSYEIELYDSGTGHLVAWVRLPSLSSSSDTVLYMYYGNPTASNQENPTGLWDSNYVMVQHLEETSGTHNDSTVYNNDGSPLGGLNQDVAGKIDGADEFDGDNDLVEVANSASLKITDAITYEAWVKWNGKAGTNYLIDNSQTAIVRLASGGYPDIHIYGHTPTVLVGNTKVTTDAWRHLVWTYDKDAGANNRRIYLDGVLVANDTQTASMGTAIDVLTIGNYKLAGSTYAFGGIIDEVRVSNMARSSAWISASYKNQHNPGAFYTIGPRQCQNPVISSPHPPDGSTGVSVSLSELSFNLTDYQGDLMNYTVTTSPHIGSGSGVNVANGRYTFSVSGVNYGTTYAWHVSVTDGTHWTDNTFTFTTEFEEPEISNENPSDGALTGLNPTLQADIYDAQGDSVDWYIMTNASGSWTTLNSGTLPTGSGTVSASTSNMDSYNTKYYWRVCATDPAQSGKWTNETYTLTTSIERLVAIHVSQDTENHWTYSSWTYFSIYEMLEEVLMSDGTPFVKVSDAEIAAGNLLMSGEPRYPILFSLAAECISDTVASQIKAYAEAGGFVYVGSSSWTKYPDGSPRTDFALSAEMGVEIVESYSFNWAEERYAKRIASNRLVDHVPGGVSLEWMLPLTHDTLPWSPSGPHSIWESQTTTTEPAEVLMTIGSYIMLATKAYSDGRFIYHSELAPLAGWGGLRPDTYEYVFFRQAIEWAFEAQGIPLTRVSAWQYQYNSAFIFRVDMDTARSRVPWLVASAQYDKSLGITGAYYIVTGEVRDPAACSPYTPAELIAMIQDAKAEGALIGSHNGGYNSTAWTGITDPQTYKYYHWGPDDAIKNYPGDGIKYANESLTISFNDLETWLGERPNIWVSPFFDGVFDKTFEILEYLNVTTSGEQNIGPFPHMGLSMETKNKHYDVIVLPTSEWFKSSGGRIEQNIEDRSLTDIQEAVDFYYNLGALVNLYGHSPSTSPKPKTFITRCLSKPYMWAATCLSIRDWWLQRQPVSIASRYKYLNPVHKLTITVSGSTSPDLALDVVLPTKAFDVEVKLDGVVSTDFRQTSSGIKVKAGLASTVTVTWKEKRCWTQTSQADFESGTLTNLDTSTVPGQVMLACETVPTLFSDNFDDPSWTATHWTVHNGTWTVEDGLYIQSDTSIDYKNSYAGDASWTNYILEARTRYVSGDYGAEIAAKLNSTTGARYAYWIYPSATGPNKARLDKFTNWNTWTQLAEADIPTDTNWHTLKMILNGSNIKCYYDGMLIMEVTDGSYASGLIDLETYGAMVQYDWVVVRELTTHYPSGTLVSSPLDAGLNAKWMQISWSASTPAETEIRFRTRTAMTEGDLSTAPWSDYTSSGSSVTSPDGRWIQYETTLLTNNTHITPILYEVTICYCARSELTKLHIDPSLVEKSTDDVCTTFELNVTIEDVEDLFGFDFNITWDNSLLTLVDVDYNSTLDNVWGPFDEDKWFLANETYGVGYYELAAVSTATSFYTIDKKTLAILKFHVENKTGETPIHFEMVKLSNSKWQTIPVQTTDGTYRIRSWYIKPPYPDYAPSGMPDFDERQNGTYNWTCNAKWSHCGPVAVANSLWWLDSKYESLNTTGAPVPPPTISDNFTLVTSYKPGVWDDHDIQNVQPLIEHLAWLMDCDGMRTGQVWCGTYVNHTHGMEGGLAQYLSWSGVNPLGDVNGDGVVDMTDYNIVNNAMGSAPGTPNWNLAADIYPATTTYPPTTNNIINASDLNLVQANLGKTGLFYEHTACGWKMNWEFFTYIEEEVERSQDVVLLLGFYIKGTDYREGGHYITVAGVNSTTAELLISNPCRDDFEAGKTPGRCPVPHQHVGEPPYTTHNNASLVSHDAYKVVKNYSASGYDLVLDGYFPPEHPWEARIEYAVVTSPKPAKPDLEIINGDEHEICHTFWVEINVTHVTDLTDFNFTIMYNHTYLEVLDYTFADSVLDSPAKTCDITTLGVVTGSIGVSNPWTGDSGLLLKLLFHVRFTEPVVWKDCAGWDNFVEAHVWFQYAKLSFLEPPDLIYEENGMQQIEVIDKIVHINLIRGDINSDGSVQIVDISLVAWYYDIEKGDLGWEEASKYDLNCDGIIDIFDLVIVASNMWYT